MNLKEYLGKAYTCYHAVRLGAQMLKKAGFADLDGNDAKNPKGYYRVVGGSLFAARAGEKGLNLALSHTDSPSLRIRYNKSELQAQAPVWLDVEKYGGGMLRSYLDRKMRIAGRVIVNESGVLAAKEVCSDFFVVVPSVAVHLGGGSEEISASRDLRPLLGVGELYAALGEPQATDGDLYCVPADEPVEAGANGEYICSPRLDNLVSVHASLRAITECRNKAACAIACFNSEETGSETREGAQGILLREFLSDVTKAAGIEQDVDKLLGSAFALSCDGAHALHPMRRDKYSESAPVLGGGVVIKRNDRYASDALTASATKEIFARAGLNTQTYFHHADLRCGSTIGLTAAHTTGAAVCDIGVAQLAMHSALETAAKSDADDLAAGLTEFFNREITVKGDNIEIK